MNNYQLAYAAATAENYSPDIYSIQSYALNPEQQYIKTECYDKLLSIDAQSAIKLILNPPREVKESFTSRGLSWNKVAEFLKKNHGWKHHQAVRIRKEIKQFLKENWTCVDI